MTLSGIPAAAVLVVGGGPAGAGLALALRRAGVGPVVIATGPPSHAPFRVGESASPGVAALLERLGLCGDLGRLGHLPCYGNLSVWGGAEPVLDSFRSRGSGRHGWHLDRAAFDRWLLDQARERGAQVLETGRLETITPEEGGGWWRARFGSGSSASPGPGSVGRGSITWRQGEAAVEVRARVVADCSGRGAVVATRLGVGATRVDRMLAVAAMVDAPDESDVPHELRVPNVPDGDGMEAEGRGTLRGLSLIEAVADGWWYAARVPGGKIVLTLMTDSDCMAATGVRRPVAFVAAWQATEQMRRLVPLPAGKYMATAVFPAPSRYLAQACGAGWIAVGDALIGMDPLTAAGIDGALDDAVAAADTIVRWFGATSAAACVDASRAYSHRADYSLRRYLNERCITYRREPRWRDRAFWQRRSFMDQGARPPDTHHQGPDRPLEPGFS